MEAVMRMHRGNDMSEWRDVQRGEARERQRC